MRVEQSGDGIQIVVGGGEPQQIATADVRLDQWDEPRYRALERRVRINWDLFNELYAQNVAQPPDVEARLNVRMKRVKDELCQDFHEMVGIYEQATGVILPDHYKLYEVCSA